MARLIRISLGVTFLILGVVGFIFPILQGWLFLSIGALLLSKDVPAFQRLLAWIKARFPRLGQASDRLRDKFLSRDR